MCASGRVIVVGTVQNVINVTIHRMLVWEIIGAIVLLGMLAAGVFILAIAVFVLYALTRLLVHGAAKLLRLGKREKAPTEPKLDRPTHVPA